MADRPTLWLVAGPNGVGKTTYAFRHIREVAGSVRFVNLDEIARGLSPLSPEAGRLDAARVALAQIDALLRRNGSRKAFTIETTLAGLTYLRRIRAAKASGWRIHLLYFALADPEAALARIARRVTEGGHDVPETEARRRFARSIANLPAYLALADLWRIYDNGGARPRTAAEGRAGCARFRAALDGLPPALRRMIGEMPDCAEPPARD